MKTRLNLLPFALQRSRQRAQWLRRAVLLWGTTLICCGSYGHIQHARLVEVRSAADQLDQSCRPVREAAETNRRMQDEVAALTRQLQDWEQREQADLPLSVVGIVSAATNQQITELQLDRLRIEDIGGQPQRDPRAKPAAPAPNADPAAAAPGVENLSTRIELSGTALTDAAVGEYVNALRSLTVFRIVELVSTQAVQIDGGQAREFRIRCAF